jgi:hypothetical protein
MSCDRCALLGAGDGNGLAGLTTQLSPKTMFVPTYGALCRDILLVLGGRGQLSRRARDRKAISVDVMLVSARLRGSA